MGDVIQRTQRFYCTFGGEHLEGKGLHHFVEVIATDSAHCHEIMYAVYGNKWSFCYDLKAFEGQPEKYNLLCIGVIWWSDTNDWQVDTTNKGIYYDAVRAKKAHDAR